MDPLVTSTLISTGASLLGGLFGKKKKGPSPEEQILHQRIANSWAFRDRLRDAKELNVHPLTALGVPLGQTGGVGYFGEESGSKTADVINEAGQGISRAVAAYASREEREMAKASAKLQLENQQLQNDRLRSEIALMHQPGSPPGISGAGSDGDARYPSQSHMPLGYGDTAPFLRLGVDAKGNPIRVYNDELGDNELLQALTAFGYSVPDWIHGNFTKPMARRLRDFVLTGKAAGRQYSKFRK